MPAHERPIEQIHYSLRREINELYWSLAIKGFGVGLVAVFGPIFIYLYFDQSLLLTAIFYTVQYAVYALLVPFSAKLMCRVGIKKLMAIANPIVGAYLILLAVAPQGSLAFAGLALAVKIIYLLLYWPARHTDFARFSSEERRGRQVGLANIFIALAKTLAPLLGGVILVQLGFTGLFVAGAIVITLASIPLFFSPEVYETRVQSWRTTFSHLFKSSQRRIMLAFAFEGIDYFIGGFLFPIFIFIVIGQLDTIGWVTSVSLIFALLFTYLIGWASDHQGNRRVISYTSIIHAVSWLLNLLIKTPLQYLFISSFFRLAETANHLPFKSYIYKRSKREGHGVNEYIITHEVAHNIGKGVAGGLIILGLSVGLESFVPYFIIAALSALLYRLIVK